MASLAALFVLTLATGGSDAQAPQGQAQPAAAQQGRGGRGQGQAQGQGAGRQGGGRAFAPPAIVWPSPPLGDGPFLLESAEERNLRVVVVTKGISHPWALAFLPDGSILITERAGRLRVVRNGVLDPTPVAGSPRVGAQSLSGLKDLALHPRFAETRWLYLSYDKPADAGGGMGVTRAKWDGKAARCASPSAVTACSTSPSPGAAEMPRRIRTT